MLMDELLLIVLTVVQSDIPAWFGHFSLICLEGRNTSLDIKTVLCCNFSSLDIGESRAP